MNSADQESNEMQEWYTRYGASAEFGTRNWGARHAHALMNDMFIEIDIAPLLKEKGIDYFYELSHSGTCYLCANGVKIRLSDHEIDHVNYDLQILCPCESDVADIVNYIMHEEMREEINYNNN